MDSVYEFDRTTSAAEQYGAVIPKASLDGVHQVAGRFSLGSEGGMSEEDKSANFSVSCRTSPHGDGIRVEVGFQMKATNPDPDHLSEFRVVTVKSRFMVLYTIADVEEFSKSSLAAFGGVHGLFNAWGFMREFLHSSLLRLELPALELPLLTGNAADALIFGKPEQEDSHDEPGEE